MRQTKLMSLVEASSGTVIGLAVSMVANATVLPALGFHVSLVQNIEMTVIYTAISVVRSYFVRRYFNRRTQ